MPKPDFDAVRRELIAATIDPRLAQLAKTMAEQGHPVASTHELLRCAHAVMRGSAHNGYTMSRVMGMTPNDTKNHPATGILLELGRYLGADAPGYDEFIR